MGRRNRNASHRGADSAFIKLDNGVILRIESVSDDTITAKMAVADVAEDDSTSFADMTAKMVEDEMMEFLNDMGYKIRLKISTPYYDGVFESADGRMRKVHESLGSKDVRNGRVEPRKRKDPIRFPDMPGCPFFAGMECMNPDGDCEGCIWSAPGAARKSSKGGGCANNAGGKESAAGRKGRPEPAGVPSLDEYTKAEISGMLSGMTDPDLRAEYDAIRNKLIANRGNVTKSETRYANKIGTEVREKQVKSDWQVGNDLYRKINSGKTDADVLFPLDVFIEAIRKLIRDDSYDFSFDFGTMSFNFVYIRLDDICEYLGIDSSQLMGFMPRGEGKAAGELLLKNIAKRFGFESVEYVEAGREDEKSHPECLKVTLRPDDDFIDKNKTKGKQA